MTQSTTEERVALPTPPAGDLALEVTGATKEYGPVKALTDVTIAVASGEVRALVGENGSGKSTLVGIVSGTVQPGAGSVVVADRALSKHLPSESQNAGVLTVFQDGSLLPTLTVAQNLYIGTPAAQRPKYGEVQSWAKRRLADYDLELDPALAVSTLAPGDRQLLEIVRAVMARPRVLVLDESTSALDAAGVDRVLELMRVAAAEGAAVLFVTHRLSEVQRVADTVTILRDGRFVGTHDVADISTERMVELMAGTKVEMEFPARTPLDPDAKELLTAQAVVGDGFGPVNLSVRAGEIIGIAGADGNGQGQLLRGLATLGTSGGVVTLDGSKLRNYRHATDEGIVYLSGDRKNESLFQALTIKENMTASVLRKLSTAGVMRPGSENTFVRRQIKDFGIRLGSPSDLPNSLSGGNQQKIAISRALATEPHVLLIDEPTQGVDVRSRMDIYRLLRAHADAGHAVVLVSSDASELAGVADRIVVMSRGKIIDDMAGIGSDEESIVGAFAVESLVIESDEGETVHTPPSVVADVQPVEAPIARTRRVPAFLRNVEATRLGGLILLILLIGALTAAQNPTFLSPLSLRNVFMVATPLAAVAIAQYFVLLVGGIDVSVGATMSVTVVVLSYLLQSTGAFQGLALALGAAIVVGAVVGLVNAWLVEKMRLSAVIATIAMLGILSGVALTLRPTPGGPIPFEITGLITKTVGVFPVALIIMLAVVILGDFVLRRTGLGLRVRAVGLNGLYANRLGIRATVVRGTAYVICGILAALGGVLLAGQVAIGDASVGEIYTLLAIAAPVIGGASLLGGRGTMIGALFGAILLALLLTLATVLRISQGVNLLFIGGITLLAMLTYIFPITRRGVTRSG